MIRKRYLFCSDNFDHFINLSEKLEKENKRLKEIEEKIKQCKIEYEDYIKLRNEDPDYKGWCNESIRLDFIKELLATKEGNC